MRSELSQLRVTVSKWSWEALSLPRKAHLANAYAVAMEVDGMIVAAGS